MNAHNTPRAIAALAPPQAMAILEAIRDAEWYIASAAAAKAKVHISTATKHLSALHGSGILERKEVTTATGRTFAYRLPEPEIRLTVNLQPHEERSLTSGVDISLAFLAELLRKAEAMGGRAVRGRSLAVLEGTFPQEFDGAPSRDVGDALERLSRSSTLTEDRLVAAVRSIRAVLEAVLGPVACKRILRIASETAGTSPAGRLPAGLRSLVEAGP